jgi:hypothetical protein
LAIRWCQDGEFHLVLIDGDRRRRKAGPIVPHQPEPHTTDTKTKTGTTSNTHAEPMPYYTTTHA